MLFRKLQQNIEKYLTSDCKRILLVDGARQVGKTYLIRYLGNKLFKNYIEINLAEDEMGNRYFKDIKNVDDFYLQLSMIAGDKMGNSKDTLVFLDEIQTYPRLMELLKFLQRDKRFKYIASGSLLGVTLKTTSSIPIGSIETIRMYPLDFEEFLIANNFGEMAISNLRNKFEKEESLPENIHNKVMDLFKKYLLVGGLPDSINIYISEKNIAAIRRYQKEIHSYYIADATKYEEQRKLKVSRIYNLLPSNMENKKKRVVIKDIENKKGSRVSNYTDEFDYLVSAGIALDVKAISTPVFPLVGNSGKNLLKLYLSDVG
ncbi:MAG: AAA family ATPase, partial [Candidatus Riflebacteria bacterium]|nr:AAA family ATPase [Candidatus Riflebacteria bacterium]